MVRGLGALAAGFVLLLFEEITDWWCVLASSPFACFVKGLGRDDALLAIQVPVGSTLGAFHPVSNLPQCMAWMLWVFCHVGLVDAGALDEGVEGLFIDTFVDIDATHQAFQIPGGLCKLVFAWCWLLWLAVQQGFDLLRSCEFLG